MIKLAFRNIFRNKRRSFLTLLAVGVASGLLLFSVSMQKGSYEEMIRNNLRLRTGHFQVQRKGYWEKQDIARKLENPGEIMKLIQGFEEVQAVAPRVNGAALVSYESRTFGALICGMDPVLEARMSTLRDVVFEGEFLDLQDKRGALVGAGLAKNLGVTLGDEFVFLGQGADGSLAAGKLHVRGLVKSGFGDMDRMFIAAPLATVQEAFSLGTAVSEVAVLLSHDNDREHVAGALRDLLREKGLSRAAVLEWPTLLPGVEQSIKIDWYSGMFFYFALVLVVGFGIANTFLMAYMERIREFGVLLSLGMKPVLLGVLVYWESVILSVGGVVFGFLLGVPVTFFYQVKGIDLSESAAAMSQYGLSTLMHPKLTGAGFVWSGGMVLVAALVLAVFPAIKSSRLKPVEALRY